MAPSPNKVPPALRPGAVIGIAAPSGTIGKKDDFEKGIRILHEQGFATTFPRNLWPGYDYLADTDLNRTKEFMALWNDSGVDCIMAARGGYGCLRLARLITEQGLAAGCKRLVGFSDVTLLHQLLNDRRKLVSFHGPVVTSLAGLEEDSLKQLKRILLDPLADWQTQVDVEVLRGSGGVRGVSCGGNLSTIVSTLGTEMAPFWRHKIVFLEDTGEPVYRIDRMLTQLYLSGAFEGVAAIVLGDFAHGLGLDNASRLRHHEAVWYRIMELTTEETVLWGGFPIGHGNVNHTIPLGLEITLDSGRRRLSGHPTRP